MRKFFGSLGDWDMENCGKLPYRNYGFGSENATVLEIANKEITHLNFLLIVFMRAI